MTRRLITYFLFASSVLPIACVGTTFIDEDNRILTLDDDEDGDADADKDTNTDINSDTNGNLDTPTDEDDTSDNAPDGDSDVPLDTASDIDTSQPVDTDPDDSTNLWASYDCSSNNWETCDPAICQRELQIGNDLQNCKNNAGDETACTEAIQLCYVDFISCVNCESGGVLDNELLQTCETSRQACANAALQL